MKKTLFFVLMILFLTIVSAQFTTEIPTGKNIDQKAIDLVDVNKVVFTPTNISKTFVSSFLQGTFLQVNFSIETIDYNYNNKSFESVTKEKIISYPVSSYNFCRKYSSKSFCLDKVNSYISQQAKAIYSNERARIRSYQTKSDYSSELNEVDFH